MTPDVEAARRALQYSEKAQDVREAQLWAARAQALAMLAAVTVLDRMEYHLKLLANEQ